MIHIIIGTKAQLVKMAPIMARLQTRGIQYNFIFTGQHKETISELLNVFKLKAPDYVLYEGDDITGVFQMVFWGIFSLIQTLRRKRKIFHSQKGIVLVHGDAFSALLGALMAKVGGLKIGYIEAGLRSFNLREPFPEEITRRITSLLADYHFCPGEFAYENSKKYNGKKINTGANTLYDTLQTAINADKQNNIEIPREKYCVVSIHRFENIFNKKRLFFIINALETISRSVKVLFILHLPTKLKLKEFDLYHRLKENKNIEPRPRYDYFQFIRLTQESEFIMTDGGSNQEENYFLGKPCLLLRNTTERKEGLGKNVIISHFNSETIDEFAQNYKKYETRPIFMTISPSDIIIDNIQEYASYE